MNRNHKRSKKVLIQNCGDYFEKHALGSTQPHPHTPLVMNTLNIVPLYTRKNLRVFGMGDSEAIIVGLLCIPADEPTSQPYGSLSQDVVFGLTVHLVAEFPGPYKVYTFYSNGNIRTPNV